MKDIIVDLHCDTVLKLFKGNDINDKTNQVTLDNCLLYNKYIQLFAMYIEPEYIKEGKYKLCMELINTFKKTVEMNKEDIKIITNRKGLKRYLKLKEKSLGAILTVEDGSCLEGDINNLDKLYKEGIRVIGLTWNDKNEIGTGINYSNTEDDGLTKFGSEVIKRMNKLGIIIDVSHLSEKTFYDVMNITKRPVIASHSCSKSICNNARNLTDEQIKLISKKGGVIGVNFYKEFVNNDKDKANLECVINHIKHIINIGGNRCVCIGSDYDGMRKEDTAKGLEDNSKLFNLKTYLKKSGFTKEDINNIMYKNMLDFLMKEL